MKRKLFGTDGVRGKANEFPVTVDNALILGRTAVKYFHKNSPIKEGKHKIVIGKDTRISSYMLEAAMAAGICSAGADAVLLGPLPTPGISFITRSMRADAGVVISASHNPFYDNGIKFFNKDGTKLSDDVELELEKAFENDSIEGLPVGRNAGKIYRVEDAQGRYVEFLKTSYPRDLTIDGISISLDCANGAAYLVAPTVFSELGGSLKVYAKTPNGENINNNVGALYPQNIAEMVLKDESDIGITLDGDGDRVILVDERGRIVDGDKVIGIAAAYFQKQGKLTNNLVVTTIMSNVGLEIYLKNKGIKMLRTGVGDRYVFEEMMRTGAVLGGENSGHIIFTEFNPTGDGIVSALQVIAIMQKEGKKLSELTNEIVLFPQIQKKITVSKKIPVEQLPGLNRVIAQKEKEIKNGRIVVRYSGTEPVLRIMAEGENEDQVRRIVDAIAEEATAELVREAE